MYLNVKWFSGNTHTVKGQFIETRTHYIYSARFYRNEHVRFVVNTHTYFDTRLCLRVRAYIHTQRNILEYKRISNLQIEI